jgi:hypothetical protein
MPLTKIPTRSAGTVCNSASLSERKLTGPLDWKIWGGSQHA